MKSKIKNQKSKIPLILASASPRRAELLRAAHIPFTVIVSPTEEPEHKPAGIPTPLWPICLAYMKAQAVHSQIENRKSKIENPPILAADTIVLLGTRILNKAPTRSAAKKMLSALNHKTHQVITGCCLMRGDRIRLFSASATCKLHLSKPQLEAYLDSNLWRGKAGAYGIQDPALGPDPFVQLLSGEFSTVVGLPIHLVQSELASFLKDQP